MEALDGSDRNDAYGLSQSDFHQLHAYGHKYLSGVGEMALVYPSTATFRAPLEPFLFEPRLRLWVLPFDLDCDVLARPNDPLWGLF